MSRYNYVEIDELGVKQTGCMRCGEIVARRKIMKTPQGERPMLVPWSNYRTYNVILSDNSQANLPICQDCVGKLGDADHPLLIKKARFGWMKQQLALYRNRPEIKQAIIDAAAFARTRTILRRA